MPQKTALVWLAVSSERQTTEDKISLPEQEEQARLWCEANGYKVIDVLSIPGHSRYESDVISALEDFAEKGVYAYHRLREYWKTGGVDVLVCYHDSRLGRSASLYTWVLENTIRAGIDIYRIMGGWVTEADSSVQNAIGILTATADLKRLMKMRKVAMPKRAERGLNVGPKPVFSHKTIFDDKGNDIRVEVDRSKQRLWDDLATVILEGVPWDLLERVLYERFGHVDTDNKPYKNRKFYDLLYTPMFWGNGAWNWRPRGGAKWKRQGFWIFDEQDPAPEGVLVFYGAHEAVYSGKTAEKVKAELRRRRSFIKGHNSPHKTKMFSGLMICNECAYSMAFHKSNSSGWMGYRCMSIYHTKKYPERVCTQRKYIDLPDIRSFLDHKLRLLLDPSPNWSAFFDGAPLDTTVLDKRIEQVENEIADSEKQARQLIRKQALADEEHDALYDEELRALAKRTSILKTERNNLLRSLPNNQTDTNNRDMQAAELRAMGLAAFWKQDERTINQVLLGIFGRYRMAVESGEIIGFDIAPPHFNKLG